MKCEIIQDLLPSYIDHLTSEPSNLEIKNHLESCVNCKKMLEEMQTEMGAPQIAENKKNINPFKKLNRKVYKAILLTLLSCALVFGMYIVLFGLGWKVNSNEIDIAYSKDDAVIMVDFTLKDSKKALNNWNVDKDINQITFTKSFISILDDRGTFPNQFSYGIHYREEDGTQRVFTDEDYFTIHYKDQIQKIYWKDVSQKLGIQ